MMKAKSFAYDEKLIASCASSSDVRFVPLRLQALDSHDAADAADAAAVPTLDIDVNRVPHNNACRTLLEQHAQHYYGRPLTTTDHDDARIIRRFLESVLLLHDFNNRHSQRSLAQQHKAVNHQSFANGKNNNHPLKPAPPEEEWLQLWKDEDWESRSLGEAFLVRLHNEDSIQKALAFHFSHHDANSTRRQLRTHYHHHHRTSLALPFDSYSPSLKIAQDYNFRETDISSSSSKKHSHKDSQEDPFSTLLNWATDQNPDGVPIVHQVHDQGSCGSCWAFAATGTLEASASRRIAFQAYSQVVRDTVDTADSKDNLVENKRAVWLAQLAERKAISAADLSVQELVDCDTWADQGCTGGNPLLAFYFIHRYGLASTASYPYVGQQDKCQIDRVANPIASVQSWGILTSNHEDNMERVLRNVGPIAVGVNGAHRSFLSYTGGIFDVGDCDQGANHALLIVGYGEELDSEGRTIKYWLARNSWGTGWGEDGYVRVKRGSGQKGQQGMCGIAKSPSVALGGILLPESGITTTGIDSNVLQSERMETSLIYNNCATVGMGNVRLCNRVEAVFKSHPAISYFFISMFVVGSMVVWPLTKECRHSRRQLRTARRLETQRERACEPKNPRSDESTHLLRLEQHSATYGLSV